MFIGVTQRVDIYTDRGERRDALDQTWIAFLVSCGITAVPLPNHLPTVKGMLEKTDFGGFLLTGGNDLSAYGGDAPERDEVESYLIETGLPILGVCRGMQMLVHHFGGELSPIEGHVAQNHEVVFSDGSQRLVNSFHCWGVRRECSAFEIWAKSEDGNIEAIKVGENIRGITWHPERHKPFAEEDQVLFREIFGVEGQ